MKLIKNITDAFSHIAFPGVCVCCGHENTQQQRQLCSFCLENRFEDANPENKPISSDTILPEGIMAQHALWKFDKGGDLQDLLHKLKYERLTTIGIDLGRRMGQRAGTHPLLVDLFKKHNPVILPVPLHYVKHRYRGFNQAFKIGQGFREVWTEMKMCNLDDVVRIKNTRSQTGFSLQKRLDNMKDAFKVKNKLMIENELIVVIDDVFTTGATTFELSKSLMDCGSGPIVILTIAQA